MLAIADTKMPLKGNLIWRLEKFVYATIDQ